MAGKGFRSGRLPRSVENLKDNNYVRATVAINRALKAAEHLTGEELMNNPRFLDQCLAITFKKMDIESKKEVAELNTAPLLLLLKRGIELERALSARKAQDIADSIQADIISTDTTPALQPSQLTANPCCPSQVHTVSTDIDSTDDSVSQPPATAFDPTAPGGEK